MEIVKKLTLERHFMNFILFMKHDNITMYGSFMWNSSKISLCDDIGLFITFCINDTLVYDIHWLMINKKTTLGS